LAVLDWQPSRRLRDGLQAISRRHNLCLIFPRTQSPPRDQRCRFTSLAAPPGSCPARDTEPHSPGSNDRHPQGPARLGASGRLRWENRRRRGS
jgi:hypothetical protein